MQQKIHLSTFYKTDVVTKEKQNKNTVYPRILKEIFFAVSAIYSVLIFCKALVNSA